jgi:hypothetical protein
MCLVVDGWRGQEEQARGACHLHMSAEQSAACVCGLWYWVGGSADMATQNTDFVPRLWLRFMAYILDHYCTLYSQ